MREKEIIINIAKRATNIIRVARARASLPLFQAAFDTKNPEARTELFSLASSINKLPLNETSFNAATSKAIEEVRRTKP